MSDSGASDDYEQLSDAVAARDLVQLRQLIANGLHINACTADGESILAEATMQLQRDPLRYDVVKLLLDNGADPGIVDEDGWGPLSAPMMYMDTRMLSMLLSHGAVPNAEAGHLPSESFYDLAEFDYRFQIDALQLPEEPTKADKVDPDAWLAFLHRLAAKYGWPAPDHLSLLRSYGAMTARELSDRCRR